MKNFDLIVIGAGPAGSAAARVAASAGLNVALIDKSVFPRDKLCGGGFTGRSMRYFEDAFERPWPVAPARRFDSVEFHAFGESVGQFNDIPPLDMIMRVDLDAALLVLAQRAGATVMLGKMPEVLSIDPVQVLLGDDILEAPLLIGADGANSQVAKYLFGQAFDRDEIGFALEVEHPDQSPDSVLRIDFGAADWGYGWHFPKEDSITIGVGGVMKRNPDIKASMRNYLKTLGIHESTPFKGQFLPFGGYRKIPGKDQVLLVGDAAGLVDPITGEGIAYAIKSGQLAAEAIVENRSDPQKALPGYMHKLKPIHSAIRQARWIRQLIFHPRFQRVFASRFRSSKTLRTEYLFLLSGQREYPEITKAMLRRIPAYFWRAFGRGQNSPN